jgi:hypothetical protein
VAQEDPLMSLVVTCDCSLALLNENWSLASAAADFFPQ